MPTWFTRPARPARPAGSPHPGSRTGGTAYSLCLALGLSLLLAAPTAAASPATAPAFTPELGVTAGDGAEDCERPLLARPAPATAALPRLAARSGDDLSLAAERNDVGRQELRRAADDGSLWLDRCGRAFYLDPATAPEEQSPAPDLAAAAGLAPLPQTFALESRPGAPVTIYLDFTGETVSGTAWNRTYGDPIVAAPFSLSAPTDTAFTDAELTSIQRAWQVVAEDYAPFDVNVTTRDPGPDAIDRSSPTDPRFGIRVVVTDSGPIGTSCGCAGVAYVGILGRDTSYGYYSPAWVFTAGTGPDGHSIGEAASHEAGHSFGLRHDGDSTRQYSLGWAPWAPIMGAGYYHPITQWSRGDYPGASNREDDVAIIAAVAGPRADDHGDVAASASPLVPGVATPGVIAQRSDVDTFTFTTGAGPVTVSAAPTSGAPNLDLSLTVLDLAGNTVGFADPPAVELSRRTAAGLDATWSGTLPAGRYLVRLDGVGHGSPSTPGGYDDYGSLGGYTVEVGVTDTALTLGPALLPELLSGRPVDAPAGEAAGGTPDYTWSATGLPSGLSLDPATGRLHGRATVAGTFAATVTVRDGRDASASIPLTLTVLPELTAGPHDLVGQAGEPFAARLVAAGGTGSHAWSAPAPHPWLRVAADGVLTGTPPGPGSSTWSVTVESGTQRLTVQVTVDVTEAPAVVVVEDHRLAAVAGHPFVATLSARGGDGSFTWSAQALPPGFALGDRGTLSGLAHEAGTFRFVVRAHSAGLVGEATVTVEVTPAPLTVTDQTVRLGYGTADGLRLAAAGGTGEYAWQAHDLPPGVLLSGDGVVTAARASVGEHRFPVQVVSGTQRAGAQVTVLVSPGPVSVVDRSVAVRAGRQVRLRLAASGGDGAFVWRARTLPRGLRVSKAGRLTGVLPRPGRYLCRVQVTSGGSTAHGVVRVRVTR